MRKCRHTKKELPSIKNSDFYQKNGFINCNAMAAYGLAKALALQERARARIAKQERADHREAKLKVKKRSAWVQDAQKLLNQIVVIEDKEKGCISCSDGGEVVDSGHYFHRGNRYRVSPLTLLRLNLNGQCRLCNQFEGGKQHDYMEGFVARYGLAKFLGLVEFRRRVDCGEIPALTIDECKALITDYKDKLKQLKLGNAV